MANGLLPHAEPAAALPAAALPSKSWKIDFAHNRISGFCDGAEAVLQAAVLLLLTPRYRHLIYSSRYGSELHTLIGRDGALYQAQAAALAEEALLTDDRILEVQPVFAELLGENLAVSFTITSKEGVIRGTAQL